MKYLPLVLAAVAACASSSPPPEDQPKGPSAQGSAHAHGEHGEHGKHHHDLAGGMKAFHDVLAPAYHMEAGAARVDKTCQSVAGMRDASGKITAEPKGDADKWKAAAKALADGVDALDKACQASGRADVGAKLEAVHDQFHALMDLAKG